MLVRFIFLLSFSVVLGSCGSFQPQGRFTDNQSIRVPSGFSTQQNRNAKQFIFPLKKFRISRGFSPSGLNHYGVDFVAPRGTSVHSSHNGKVIFAGRGFSGYGKLIIVEHPDNYASFYAHLHRVNVREGQIVHQNEVLGQVGATGNARGVHLHFELKIGTKAVDPMKHLKTY